MVIVLTPFSNIDYQVSSGIFIAVQRIIYLLFRYDTLTLHMLHSVFCCATKPL